MATLTNSSFSTPYLLGAATVLFVAYRIFQVLSTNAKIRRLGARAPVRTSYVPLSLDMAYDTIIYALNEQMYELWIGMFAKYCGPGRYTIEAGIGERVILTADPENIKAILATQFKDYGKGEQFRREWYEFLGNCTFDRLRDGKSGLRRTWQFPKQA